MRAREKLTLEEKVSLALELIKRERPLDEIRTHYRVSHTTAYKVRNMFLEGGRAALGRDGGKKRTQDLEDRVRALEEFLRAQLEESTPRQARPARSVKMDGRALARKQ